MRLSFTLSLVLAFTIAAYSQTTIDKRYAEELPDWFFYPPKPSVNEICAIGISDPGMEYADGIKLAKFRAKQILSHFIVSSVKGIDEIHYQSSGDDRFSRVSHIAAGASIATDEITILKEYITHKSEVIVLIKYRSYFSSISHSSNISFAFRFVDEYYEPYYDEYGTIKSYQYIFSDNHFSTLNIQEYSNEENINHYFSTWKKDENKKIWDLRHINEDIYINLNEITDHNSKENNNINLNSEGRIVLTKDLQKSLWIAYLNSFFNSMEELAFNYSSSVTGVRDIYFNIGDIMYKSITNINFSSILDSIAIKSSRNEYYINVYLQFKDTLSEEFYPEKIKSKLLVENNNPPEINIFKSKIYNDKINVTGQAIDEDEIKEILINSESINFDNSGNFNHIVSIDKIQNEIIITAIDLFDNKSQRNIAIIPGELSSNINISEQENFSKSDVDKNIPTTKNNYPNKYVLIIGNEDYTTFQPNLTSESNVKFARKDAKIFAKYFEKTLGIPNENITVLTDAISSVMKREIKRFVSKAQYGDGDIELIFYYSGHGFPDLDTEEAYIMPVDISADFVSDGIRLNDLYKDLTEFPCKRVTVFLDACFSGGGRDEGLLAAKSVKVNVKENIIDGNMVVFTSSTGSQESLFYKEKQHGLFTYFLLKKLQDSEGDVTYDEMNKYLIKKIPFISTDIMSKEQNPQVLFSRDIEEEWENWKFN